MLPRNHPDRIRIVSDDHRLDANAGLLLTATFAQHLNLSQLADRHLNPGDAQGRANTARGPRADVQEMAPQRVCYRAEA